MKALRDSELQQDANVLKNILRRLQERSREATEGYTSRERVTAKINAYMDSDGLVLMFSLGTSEYSDHLSVLKRHFRGCTEGHRITETEYNGLYAMHVEGVELRRVGEIFDKLMRPPDELSLLNYAVRIDASLLPSAISADMDDVYIALIQSSADHGITPEEGARVTRLPVGEVHKTLRLLEQEGFMHEKHGRYKLSSSLPPCKETSTDVPKQEHKIDRVYRLAQEKGRITTDDIAELLGMRYQNARYYVRILTKKGLLQRARRGVYTPAGSEAL